MAKEGGLPLCSAEEALYLSCESAGSCLYEEKNKNQKFCGATWILNLESVKLFVMLSERGVLCHIISE